MMLEGKCEPSINDVSVTRIGLCCVGPESAGNIRIIVDASPRGVLLQGKTIACRLRGIVGLGKDCGVPQKHIEFDQHEFTQDKLLILLIQGLEELSGMIMEG
jgi:hypothetical protein